MVMRRVISTAMTMAAGKLPAGKVIMRILGEGVSK